MGTSGTSVCACEDWHLEVEGPVLRMRPSGRTTLERLWATLLCSVLLGLLIWVMGFPPGSKEQSGLQRRLDRARERVGALEVERSRMTGGSSAIGAARVRQVEAELDRARGKVREAEAALAAPPVRPATGVAVLYWGIFGLLVGAGVLIPLSGVWERVTIDATEPGRLAVVRRGQVLRSRSYDLAEFLAMPVLVSQVVSVNQKHGTVRVHGWRWHVQLMGKDAKGEMAALVDLQVDREATLPTRLEVMTPRVRQVVKFLGEVTALEAGPPIQVDVMSVERGLTGMKVRRRARQAGRPGESSGGGGERAG